MALKRSVYPTVDVPQQHAKPPVPCDTESCAGPALVRMRGPEGTWVNACRTCYATISAQILERKAHHAAK